MIIHSPWPIPRRCQQSVSEGVPPLGPLSSAGLVIFPRFSSTFPTHQPNSDPRIRQQLASSSPSGHMWRPIVQTRLLPMNLLNREIRDQVRESSWRGWYGDSPHATYSEIVMKSFDEVKKTGRHASACRLYDMYHPEIGALRKSKSYSALAPTNAMRLKDRRVAPDLRPYKPYKPKQNEWKAELEKLHHAVPAKSKSTPSPFLPPLPPTSRRQMPVPADATRFENFYVYWNGRAKGLDLSEPFLYEPHRDNYGIMEDRRYHRLYWAQHMVPSQPSARHGRQIMLTAY